MAGNYRNNPVYVDEEIGIPCIYGLDQNHGTTYTLDGTLFPQNINLGASFNPDLAYEAARVTAYETRASNCPWTYSPSWRHGTHPLVALHGKTMGDQSSANSIMASTAVRGFQGDDPNHIPADRIATSVKTPWDTMPRTEKTMPYIFIVISELRENCFAPFKSAAKRRHSISW